MHDLEQWIQSCGGTPQHPLPPHLNESLINAVFCPISSTNLKHLKLDHCLEIDDRRSLCNFGEVT